MAVIRRNTWQSEAIRKTLAAQTRFVSAQQLHETLKQQGKSIGLATVYRQLTTLVEADEVDVMQSLEGESLYRTCETEGHHHHLICTVCGRVDDVSAPEVEQWVDRIRQSHGFKVSSHVANVYGTCEDCQHEES